MRSSTWFGNNGESFIYLLDSEQNMYGRVFVESKRVNSIFVPKTIYRIVAKLLIM